MSFSLTSSDVSRSELPKINKIHDNSFPGCNFFNLKKVFLNEIIKKKFLIFLLLYILYESEDKFYLFCNILLACSFHINIFYIAGGVMTADCFPKKENIICQEMDL